MQKLYYNGIILTMEENALPEAVLTENGVITQIGSYDTLAAAAQNAEKIDLMGKTMLPAFIDAHSHFSSYANSFLQVPLEECTTFDEIAQRVKDFIAVNHIAAGQWVAGKGYDHNTLLEKRHPDLHLVDACAPENPLVLQHVSGHVGVFNTKAMTALGITPDTPSPAGGVIGHENGALTGYMEENAFFTFLKNVPLPDMEALMSAYEKAQEGYAAHGITTMQEGMAVSQMIPLFRQLLSKNMLKLDLVGYADLKDADALFAAFPASVQKYDRHFKINGYKIFLDGSPQGRTAWMKQPYLEEQDDCGYGTMQDSQVLAAVQRAAESGMQLLAHCNGDAAAQQYIDAIKTVSGKADIAKLRPVMIHAQLLAKEQLPEVKATGLIPSFFIAHVFHWGDIHVKNFGIERAAAISPAGSALARGILFTFHQDTPVLEPDMLETVWCAVNRVTKSGVVLGAEERISAYDALKAVTLHAAYQYFEENTKGSIAVGKHADFVILDQNPLTVAPMAIRDIAVLATIKEDKVLYEAPCRESANCLKGVSLRHGEILARSF
ncbi:MAG: amidohydrolase [Ruthenibacterium sp.]